MTYEISNNPPEYGSVEFYESQFSDIIADAGSCDTFEQNKEAVEKILKGFEAAIKSWLRYHSHCSDTYRYMLNKYSISPD